MEGINTATTSVPTTQKDIALTDEGEKGALYGSPPPVFDGDTSKTKAFDLAVKGWRAVNWRKAVMRNPYTRTALILNFICGKNVDDWVSHQFDLLIERVKNGMAETDETLWDHFIDDFGTAFVDIGHQQKAYAELEGLKMVNDNLEQYIATFNRLLKQAGFQATDLGSVERFKKGLKQRLQIACLKRATEPVTMEDWQKAAKEENLVYLKIQQLVKSNPLYTQNFQKPFTPKPFQYRGQPTKYWKPKGPNAMNVDAVQTGDSQGQKEQRKETRECFFCKKKGHIKKDCYLFSRAQKEERARPTQNRVTEIVDDRSVIEDEEGPLTGEKLGRMLMSVDEETRAAAIEEMVKQDFSMGPN